MNYRIVTVTGLVLILFTLLGCAPREISTSTQAGTGMPLPGDGAKPIAATGWEESWKMTLDAAKKEGKVVVYASSIAPAVKESVPIFKQKFGIDLEVITGRGTELRNRLIQERANGIYVSDIMVSGLNTIFGAVKTSGAIAPIEPLLILPEVLDEKVWFGGKFPWGDKDRLVVNIFYYPSTMININTDVVRPDEIKSLNDLLDPKWKNKIIINDPTVTGSGFNGFASLLYNKVVDQDYFRKMVSQQNQMLRDQRLQADWLARAKYPIALWAVPEQLAAFQEAGSPIASIQPVEGTYLSIDGGGVVLVKGAPHPNAAKIFINWILSKEGHTFIQDKMQQHGARNDIPTQGIDQERVRKPGGKYFIGANSIEEWVLTEQDKYLDIAKQVFFPLTER